MPTPDEGESAPSEKPEGVDGVSLSDGLEEREDCSDAMGTIQGNVVDEGLWTRRNMLLADYLKYDRSTTATRYIITWTSKWAKCDACSGTKCDMKKPVVELWKDFAAG